MSSRIVRLHAAIGICVLTAAWAPAWGQTKIEWDSQDVVESRMTRYKYERGPDYPKPGRGEPDPGSNYGSISLTVEPGEPRLLDKVLKRDAKLTGRIAGAPKDAQAGSVWIEDNYGRVLDRAEVKAPGFAFKLDAARSLHTGLYIHARLTGGDKELWSSSSDVRMVPTDEDPWGDFLLGVYNMGTREGTGALWREMGMNHRAVQTTNSPDFPVSNDLQFHASNIVYSLLGIYHRDYKRWREIQAAEAGSRGPVTLARHRCLSDPTEQKFIQDILTAAAMRFRPYRPLHYSIGDEIGIGDMASPHDLCGSKWCMGRYRAWLKDRYGSIDKLNAQWGTTYAGWDDVEMFSNWQALDRATAGGNFSPWADRLEFMDVVLYDAIARGAAAIRAIDPQATCNISGFQQPSCWGFDHYRLARTVNCATPYEIGESPDVLMSFWGDGATGHVHMPGFGQDTEGLWRSFLRGYGISQQWDSFGGGTYSKLIDIEQEKLTPQGEQVKQFADWVHAGPGRLRGLARRQRDPVAFLHSQPSLRGNWILEMTARPDVADAGAGWIRRGSWSVRKKEMSFRVRVSWVQWMHDVGVWPYHVDTRQLAQGRLREIGCKVLVLPRVVAMSDETAAAVRQFAADGGTVIADTWCGLMDGACRMRKTGVLDEMFGVSRGDWAKLDLTRIAPGGRGIALGGRDLPFTAFEKTLKAAGGRAAGASGGADVVIARQVGKGRVIYLNFDMESYFLHRLSPGMTAGARLFLLERLAEAGVRPMFPVSEPASDAPHPVGHDVCAYASGRGFLVGVGPNPTVMYSDVGGVETRYAEIKGNVFLKPHPARLAVPAGLWSYDLTDGGKALGDVRGVEFASQPLAGRFYAFWPFEIRGLSAEAAVTSDRRLKIAGKVATSAPIVDEKLAVFLRVLKPDGAEQRAYRRTIDCRGEGFAAELPLAVNEHGDWTVVLREPCTGQEIRRTVHLP
ncbi:MAG TPA: beta-galactosidase [Phycisphaerae bacterium]|nr:beta-galactosidase [Phycisphaerae bacterium]